MSDHYQTRCITGLAAVEEELTGSLHQWEAVVNADPFASAFQGPAWCMNWYRCYADSHTPFVVAVMAAGRLVGIVPLAVENRDRLIFAGGDWADYSDIAALPGY